MPRRLLSAAAASVLVLCSLAACGDKTGETITDPPPDLGIESPSDGGGQEPSDGGRDGAEPTADAPDIPAPDPADFAGMDENTPEGAEQAFRYYIAVSLWSHTSGDTSTLEALESSDCNGCMDLNGDIANLNSHNIYWSQFEISDVGSEVYESSLHDHEVGYFFTLSDHQRPNNDFSDLSNPETVDYISVGGLDWIDGGWMVTSLSAEWAPGLHDA